MKSSLPRLLACALVFLCAAPPALAQGGQQGAAAQQQARAQQQSQQQPAQQQPSSGQPPAQVSAEADEVLQVNTRVVFLDALVTDKKTRSLAQDLKAENFEVLADGRRRDVTYFSREGDAARRPLALALVFDVRDNGSGRYLRRADILEAMAKELAKLPPADEVAVLALDTGEFDGTRVWLSSFTRDRAQTASALAVIPKLADPASAGVRAAAGKVPRTNSPHANDVADNGVKDDADKAQGDEADKSDDANRGDAPKGGDAGKGDDAKKGDAKKGDGDSDEAAARAREEQSARAQGEGMNVTIGGGRSGIASVTLTAANLEDMKTQLEDLDKIHGRPGEVDEVDRYVDKKGRELTRTLKPDGTLLIQRINQKDGTVEVDVHNNFTLPRAVFDVTRLLARERPNSQAAIVYVTDGITLMAYPERDYVEHRMLKRNAIFNALVTDMKTGFKLAKPLLAPLGNLIGLNIYGGAQHIAKETGGEALRVRRPSDYAEGLARIVGNLNARYSLGFTLAENETDDGRLHALEVRARAKDAKGKDRKLEVKTRRGYFMPVTKRAGPLPDAAKKTDDDGTQTERVKN